MSNEDMPPSGGRLVPHPGQAQNQRLQFKLHQQGAEPRHGHLRPAGQFVNMARPLLTQGKYDTFEISVRRFRFD